MFSLVRPTRLPLKTLSSLRPLGHTHHVRHLRIRKFTIPDRSRPPNLGPRPPGTKNITIYIGTQQDIKLYIIFAVIGINVAVFTYGMYANAQAREGFPKRLHNFFRNMTLNLTRFEYDRRWWTVLTSNYTHLSIVHLGCNMLVFYTMGGLLAMVPAVSPARFLIIILGSGLLGSAGHLWHRSQQLGPGGQDEVAGLGFSGALMGVSTVATFYFPTAKMLLMGVIPMPLFVLTGGYALYDGYFLNDSNSRVGHAGHLGGMVFGVLYYLLRLRGLGV